MYKKLENNIDNSMKAQRERLLEKKKRNMLMRRQQLYHIWKPQSKSVDQ